VEWSGGLTPLHSVYCEQSYEVPEYARISQTGRPSLLTDRHFDEIIKYASECWDNRVLDYTHLHDELKLECIVKTLERRLKQRGYF
jgi:hypothetical protein